VVPGSTISREAPAAFNIIFYHLSLQAEHERFHHDSAVLNHEAINAACMGDITRPRIPAPVLAMWNSPSSTPATLFSIADRKSTSVETEFSEISAEISGRL